MRLPLLCLGLLLAAGTALANPEGENVFSSACTRCHGAERICANLGKDAKWWQKTASRMIRNGAPITPDQAAAAGDFLAAQAPGSKPVCQ